MLACTALASLCFAAQASASDTFTLENNSHVAFTTEVGEATCATGAFAEEFGTIAPGQSASIELSRVTPECDPDFKTQGYTGLGGHWTFEPDDPMFGEASLECNLEGE